MSEYLRPADRAIVDGLEEFEIVYAKDQPEYIPLRTLRGAAPHFPVLSRWTLTGDQREAVANGADIFLETSVCQNKKTGLPNPLQPVRMLVSSGLDKDRIGEEYALAEVER